MKAVKFFIVALGAVILSACAAAPGQKFSGLAAPKNELGDVYLYRTEALAASGSAFEVTLDGKKIGDLYNASFLHLELPTGNYLLKVSPPGLSQSSELRIQSESGKAKFFQYDFVTGPLYNIFFIGSSIQPKDATLALNDLKDLNSAK